MNQIETLKWIAENGNPIGTDVESSYNQYKTDPKFKKIAISLAESEGGYAGIPDSIKTEYQSYKSEINKSIADSLRAKAKSDYENETQSTYFGDVVKLATPRKYEAEGAVQKGIASLLDLGSFPGRTVAGLTAGLAKGLATKDWEEGLQTASDIMGRKSSPEGSGVLGFVEDVVKDPLLPIAATAIPGAIAKGVGGIGKVGEWVASHPKTAAGLAAGLGNLAIGGTERWVDPTREVIEPGTMAVEGTLGFGLGSGARGLSQIIDNLGTSEIGRAILRKITPTELKVGLPDRLAAVIKDGYGVDITENGKVDARKLGQFLSDRSVDVKGSKIERIPEWISSEKTRSGEAWNKILAEASEDLRLKEQKRLQKSEQSGVDEQLAAMDLPTAQYSNPLVLLNDIVAKKKSSGELFSMPEATKLAEDLKEIMPHDILTHDRKLPVLNAKQMSELMSYLYNEGREMSPKYHKTRDELATELRERLVKGQENIVGEQNRKSARQYSAMSELENLTAKSNYFNPDRPSSFFQGIKSEVSRAIPEKTSPIAKEVIQSMIRRGSRKEGQSPSFNGSRESNQSEIYSSAIDSLYASGKLSDADRRVAQRQLDALRFNPNDTQAKATLDSLTKR